MNEIPDAYKEAAQHTEKESCKSETLEQWTMQKIVQHSQKSLNANVICSFWNCSAQLSLKKDLRG
jgi:uncharacterized protein YktB (UPF0637 family)